LFVYEGGVSRLVDGKKALLGYGSSWLWFIFDPALIGKLGNNVARTVCELIRGDYPDGITVG
jgi:hypothetical protein